MLNSACSADDVDEIYTMWNDAFAQWREENQDCCYGFIATDEFEAFICYDGRELYCGRRNVLSETQELFYKGASYHFSGGSTIPIVTDVNEETISNEYCAIKETIAHGVIATVDSQTHNYEVYANGFFGDVELPLFCNMEDQVLIIELSSAYQEEEFAHMAYQRKGFNFVYNMNYTGATQKNAILLLVGQEGTSLYGWKGYDVKH